MIAAATHRAGARPWVWWHTAPRWQRWPVAFVVWFCIIGVFSVAMTDMAYAECRRGDPGCGLRFGNPEQAGVNLLPAWRWSDRSAGLHANVGSSLLAGVTVSIAGLFLAVASIIWRITLFLLDAAMGVDIVSRAADGVNDGYLTVFDAVTDSGITITLTILAVAVIGVRVAMGSEQNPGRSLFRLALAIGLVFMFAQGAATNGVTSPGNVMVSIDSMTSVLASGLLESFNGIAEPEVGDASDKLDCANYTAELYEMYEAEARRGAFIPAGTSGGTDEVILSRRLAQAQMSLLWEEAYLSTWTSVQFGDPGLGRVMRCRYLEIDSAQPIIQLRIQQRFLRDPAAGGGEREEDEDAPRTVFNQIGSDEEMRRNMAAWATCGWRPGGGYFIRDDWTHVNGGPDNGGPTEDECEVWYEEGDTEPGENPGPWHIEEGVDINRATDDEPGAPRARDYYRHLNGHVGGGGVGASLLALVVAGVFAWALIGLSLGLIIAQFGIILAFICLPILLLVRAWPGDGAAEISKKMARSGVGMMFSKVVFVTALSILVTLMTVLRELTEVSGLLAAQQPGGGLTGADAITSSLVIGLIPLASVILLRKAGDAIGLKGLGTLKGTASLVANAANPNGGGAAGAVGAKADRLGRRARNAVGREVRMRRHIHRQQKLKDKRDDEREKRKGEQGQIGDADDDTKPAGKGKEEGKPAGKSKEEGKPAGKGPLGGDGPAGEVEGPGRGRRALATFVGGVAASAAVPLVGAAAYALGAASLGLAAPAVIGAVGGLAAYKHVKHRLTSKEVPRVVEEAATSSRDRFVADAADADSDDVVEPESAYTWERVPGGGYVPADPRPAGGPATAPGPEPAGPPVTGRRPG